MRVWHRVEHEPAAGDALTYCANSHPCTGNSNLDHAWKSLLGSSVVDLLQEIDPRLTGADRTLLTHHIGSWHLPRLP
jgi:hypothetical protein